LRSQCGGTLIWSDEFNGSSLNTTNWTYDIGDGCPSLCGWGNNELEYYTNSTNNVRVGGGLLTIETRAENMGGRNFTSGKIHTNGKFSQTYGRFEASLRLPNGNGLWPAFWMLATANTWPTSGEIDIMEFRGDILNRVDGTLHYGNAWPANQNDGSHYYHSVNDLHTSFHTYAVEWEPGEIRWYFDNIRFKTETQTPNSLNPPSNNANAWPWNTPFYIILNQAVGGWFTGVTLPANVVINKGTYEIDYVRVYDMTPSIGSQTPYFGTPVDLPATIQAENFDRGCDDAAYSDQEIVNQGGQYREEDVDIEACTDAGGGYDVGWINTNEWLEYTVNVPVSGMFNFFFRVAAQTAGGRIRLEVDGVSAGTTNVPATGGWQTWQSISLNGVNITSGNHVLRVFAEVGNFNFNYFGSSQVTLPAFSLFAQYQSSELTWYASETNASIFEIQVLQDSNWETIEAMASTGKRNYQQEINAPGPIRVVQLFENGTRINSNIIYPNSESVQIWPIPFNHELTVSNSPAKPLLMDILGNTLAIPVIQKDSEWIIQTDNIMPGVYFLNTSHRITKVIKE
jgi:beta-glucanase (GH16 family)